VSTDALNFSKKQRVPTFTHRERVAIVGALRCVDAIFSEESLERKAEYIRRYRADVLVMGDDWAGKFDHFSGLCRVAYLSRTEGISSTEIRNSLKEVSP
jgi:glycerol-3-phosphate cytidylyltransferase